MPSLMVSSTSARSVLPNNRHPDASESATTAAKHRPEQRISLAAPPLHLHSRNLIARRYERARYLHRMIGAQLHPFIGFAACVAAGDIPDELQEHRPTGSGGISVGGAACLQINVSIASTSSASSIVTTHPNKFTSSLNPMRDTGSGGGRGRTGVECKHAVQRFVSLLPHPP